MRQFSFAWMLLLAALPLKCASPFAGRWDITVTTPNSTYPGWMDLVETGGDVQVRVQPRGGSVHPVTVVNSNGSHLSLLVAKANTKSPEMTWELEVTGDRFSGVQKSGSNEAKLAGVRAPELKRPTPKAWTNPEPIFNGKDLTGWEPLGTNKNNWVAQDGVLLNEAHGANLRTTRAFDDFKLHIEYNCPQDGNSGVYLRGRYEVQVEYETTPEDKFHMMGAIYGFVGPTADVPRKVNEWESFDITLIGRHVTVVRDGVKTIDNQEIPGITGGALDSNESEPGPFYLQGDHTGGMKYRNITVSVPKR
jgi:hypothetical protein